MSVLTEIMSHLRYSSMSDCQKNGVRELLDNPTHGGVNSDGSIQFTLS